MKNEKDIEVIKPKKAKVYPAFVLKVSEEQRVRLKELKNKYYVNVPKMLRDTIDNIYNNIKSQENSEKYNENN